MAGGLKTTRFIPCLKKKIVHTIDLIASPPNDADAENNLSFLP